MNSYLIPANSKKSALILGLFKPFDLGLFAGGLMTTFILFLAVPLESTVVTLIAVAPGLITGFLVLPVPNYYNVRTFIKSAWEFYTTRQKFVWKGWCFTSEQEDKK